MFRLPACLCLCLFAVNARAAEYYLPFKDRWFVMAAGDTLNVNHHMVERSQWYAVDFMKTGGASNRAIAKNNGEKLTDYYSWGAPVISPVSGTVLEIHNEAIDQLIGQQDEVNAFGNYVLIEAGPNEFVYLAHFQQHSIVVKPNTQVKAGQLLGKCGNSGNTTGPHIHLHVQTMREKYTGVGQNITFQNMNVLLTGKEFHNVNWPLITGLFVWPE